MKASDVSLILTTTEGYFTEGEVPELYVQIQSHRAEIERRLSRQISFEDALYSWMENIYSPIMDAIENNMKLYLCSIEKGISEVYFEIYRIAEEDDFLSISQAAEECADKSGNMILALLVALFAKRKKASFRQAI